MKVISISQPFATLIVKGFKVFETRSWAAPNSIIGKELGIASTISVKGDALAHTDDPAFKRFYAQTGLPPFKDLCKGHLLGTVIVDSCEKMTDEMMDDVSDEEKSYGWWEIGSYAWRLRNPRELNIPVVIQGKQGIYDWHGSLPSAEEECQKTGALRPAYLWSGLSAV